MIGHNLTNAIGKEQGIEIFDGGERQPRRPRPDRAHHEAARDIPVFAETDVLVVGVAAALCAGLGVQPQSLPPHLIQRELLRQGAYLSPAVATAANGRPLGRAGDGRHA